MPTVEQVSGTLPSAFRFKYPNSYAIIDGSEIFIETPSDLHLKSSTWSQYMHHNTTIEVKFCYNVVSVIINLEIFYLFIICLFFIYNYNNIIIIYLFICVFIYLFIYLAWVRVPQMDLFSIYVHT